MRWPEEHREWRDGNHHGVQCKVLEGEWVEVAPGTRIRIEPEFPRYPKTRTVTITLPDAPADAERPPTPGAG